MTDAWLLEQAGRASFIATNGFEEPDQAAAFLRGMANRVLMTFGQDWQAAFSVPYTRTAAAPGPAPSPDSSTLER